jgi:DNA-binding winged helix-turn-helix (wHTH) protein/tetratricopeptide (TPR) repeat protein
LSSAFRFGPFTADRAAYAVTRDGEPVALTPKLLDLLFCLLDHREALVTKEALLDTVWPGANVTDNALAQAVSELRDVLGDAAASPRYIRTVARRGYRFIAPIDVLERAPADAASRTAAADRAIVQTPPPGATDKRTLVVLDFVNMTGDPDVAWLGPGIAETVTSDLAAMDHFNVVDRWRARQAARRAGTSLEDLAGAVAATLVVTGSYQRSGSRLRITARIVDLDTGDAIADVKVDGRLEDIFALQDGIVSAFARELGIALAPRVVRPGVRETASLEAYRAYMEGWLRIEGLDTTVLREAIRDFERAIALDPRYAMAFTGLANAEFVAFEMTRASPSPDFASLTSGIAHARHAIHLDDGLAEAHATLSFLLTSAGEFDEARQAAQRAVVMEPDNWRHWYRLGHAAWGGARLKALDRSLRIHARFAYAHFEGAMVSVARGEIDDAADRLRDAMGAQDRAAQRGDRFPGVGFHWLLGSLFFVKGDLDEALASFDRELAQIDRRRLYGPEYAAVTLAARGHVQLARGDVAAATASFNAALGEIADYPRALLGVLAVAQRRGDRPAAADAAARLSPSLDPAARPGRRHHRLFIAACRAAVEGARDEAVAGLEHFLSVAPVSATGWTIPIEPFLRPLHGHPGFSQVLTRLADRAR